MQKKIETERLILRAFRISDSERVAELAGEKIIADMTVNIPHPYDGDMARCWIETHLQQTLVSNGVVYAITLKGDDSVIGAVSIPSIENGFGSLGYWLGVPYWGKAIMLEAAQALIEYCKVEHNLNRLHVVHLIENERSKAVIKKLGIPYLDTKIELENGEEREVCIYESDV